MGVLAPSRAPRAVGHEQVRGRPWVGTGITIVALSTLIACFAVVGADLYWLVALGKNIAAHGRIPDGLPFATAPVNHWVNVPVGAELLLAGIHALGDPALTVAQVLIDAATLLLLALGARREGAADGATSLILVVVTIGSAAAFVVVRVQMFSLILFAALLLLIRNDQRTPSRRIWLVPGLVMVWTNLHGVALLGVAIFGAYLLFSRMRIRVRIRETIAVGSAALAGLLVTPAGLGTAKYYLDYVDEHRSIRLQVGMWARPTFANPFDVLMMVAALLLVIILMRHRRPLWEYIVLGALAAGTVTAARYGVWLLMTAAAPAAAAITRPPTPTRSQAPSRRPAAAAALVIAALSTGIVHARGGGPSTDSSLVPAVASMVGERVVLAPEPLVELLAAEGVTVWAGNPIDAFSHGVQRKYLDFIEGNDGGRAAAAQVGAVVVENGSPEARLMRRVAGFRHKRLAGAGWTLYLRRR